MIKYEYIENYYENLNERRGHTINVTGKKFHFYYIFLETVICCGFISITKLNNGVI